MLKQPFVLSLSLMILLSASASAADPKPLQDGPSKTTLLSANDASSVDVGTALNARIINNYTGRKYRLGPNDVLSVNVYDSPEFTQENLLVMPDGNVNVAPFGSINVAGQTIDDVQKDLSERLKGYLNDPQVTVKLEKTKPFQVYVSGAVLHPGAYEMVTDMNRAQVVSNSTPEVLLERKTPLLSNVLVASGGLRYDADLEHVKIRNKFDGQEMDVNLLQLLQGDSDQDVFLIAGDTVEVPALATPYAVDEQKYKAMLGSSVFQKEIPIKIYGYVNKPGLVMLDSAQSANLNSAIGEAGGFLSTDASYSPSKVFVSRVDQNGRLATVAVDPRHEDMTLHPNDIVYVPSKTVPKVGRAFDFLTRVVTPLAGIASGANNWSLLFNPTRYNVNLSGR